MLLISQFFSITSNSAVSARALVELLARDSVCSEYEDGLMLFRGAERDCEVLALAGFGLLALAFCQVEYDARRRAQEVIA